MLTRILNNLVIMVFSVLNIILSLITIMTLGLIWVYPIDADTISSFLLDVVE